MERNAGLGTSSTADNAIRTVSTGEQHGLAGRVHRLGHRVHRCEFLVDQCLSEPRDDEERVVDAQRQREHQREVHRPDRDVEHLGADEQHARGRHQPEDRQQQRQAGSHERPERQQEDQQGHRPGDQLRLQHRLLVCVVEVRPHRRCSGEAGLDAARSGGGDGGLEVGRRAHHVVRSGRRSGDDHGRSTVGRDRRPWSWGAHRADPAVATEDRSHPRDGRTERGVLDLSLSELTTTWRA